MQHLSIALNMGFILSVELFSGTTGAWAGKAMLNPIDDLRVRLATPSTAIPDPARIESTGDWYYLDHVSSGLAAFDSGSKRFVPLFAESWSIGADGTHLFRLKPNIRFHDGTPITSKDVLWSIKRQLLLKTSTHFPLWDYILGCDHIKRLDEECEGLRALSGQEIAIRLKVHTDSFFLQLASPETGIWSAADMNPETGQLKPTKFSGPYSVSSVTDQEAVLARNPNSPISVTFPNSPKRIHILAIPMAQMDQALQDRQVDLIVRSYRPFGEKKWEQLGVSVTATTPSMILYLAGTGRGPHPAVGRDLVEALWKFNRDPKITAAETFLPFSGTYSLSRADFLTELPDRTAKSIRVLCPKDFYSFGLLEQIRSAAKQIGVDVVYSELPGKQWLAAFDDPKASEKYDFILDSYAASERYPAVQLRYITGSQAQPPLDLKAAESPDLTQDRIKILRDYQKWLLKSAQAVPLYFNVMLFLHQDRIDLGEQPSTDAEIELWRAQERTQ